MLTIKMQNSNSSEYVTISTAPFLSSGGKRSCPRKRGQPPTVLGSTWRISTTDSIAHGSAECQYPIGLSAVSDEVAAEHRTAPMVRFDKPRSQPAAPHTYAVHIPATPEEKPLK